MRLDRGEPAAVLGRRQGPGTVGARRTGHDPALDEERAARGLDEAGHAGPEGFEHGEGRAGGGPLGIEGPMAVDPAERACRPRAGWAATRLRATTIAGRTAAEKRRVSPRS